MRMLFAIGVAFLLSGIAAVGCGGYPIFPPMQEEAVELPAVRREREIVEAAGAEALRQYIVARLSMEELARRETEGGNPEELAGRSSRALHLWQDVGETAERAERMAAYLESIEQKEREPQGAISSGFPAEERTSFLPTAHASMPRDAEKEEALRKERERLIHGYAAYPAGKQIRILAEQIERDAKAAQILLEQAQEETLPQYGEDVAFLREKCSVVLLMRSMGGAVHRETPEAETAAAWFWGESDTVADIRLASSKVLLGRHPHILFLVDAAEIRTSGTTLAIPVDSVEKLLAQYMDAAPEGDIRKWLEKLEAELGNS